MTLVDESPQKVHKLIPLYKLKENIILGSCNVRTMYATGPDQTKLQQSIRRKESQWLNKEFNQECTMIKSKLFTV
ncbi:Hypothetical predicted protein [Mytilus galloprovincialis]|uniref:Uncharacterized protein n=1 Tax=Mytilus galloprovincialis TaxID=29158 RepID=A0A8B6DKI8_MYTGA|nr:Hypothetical predicted protein [Mytilus galloprovincialis]